MRFLLQMQLSGPRLVLKTGDIAPAPSRDSLNSWPSLDRRKKCDRPHTVEFDPFIKSQLASRN